MFQLQSCWCKAVAIIPIWCNVVWKFADLVVFGHKLHVSLCGAPKLWATASSGNRKISTSKHTTSWKHSQCGKLWAIIPFLRSMTDLWKPPNGKIHYVWFIHDFTRFWWQYTVPSMGSLYWENGWNIDSRGPYCYCRCRSILSRHGIQLRSCGSQPCAVTVQNIPKHSNKELNSFGWDTHWNSYPHLPWMAAVFFSAALRSEAGSRSIFGQQEQDANENMSKPTWICL